MSKFHRTVIEVVVLSETPLDGCEDLGAINDAITTGDCVGTVKTKSQTELTGRKTADALYAAGSEPGFFQLDDDGNKIED
jgi:hypothetical protein